MKSQFERAVICTSQARLSSPDPGENAVTSELQIEANRRNGQLSTGPRTPEGKAAIRFNALKHGLTAQHITLFDECAEDFEAFHAELVAALRPKGAVEQALAERAVLCAWRLRRVYRFETGLFRKARGLWSNGSAETTCDVAVVFLRLASHEDDLSKLTRYETTLERSLQRALRALERRQILRGEGAFAPIQAMTFMTSPESGDSKG